MRPVFTARKPLVGQGPLIVEASNDHIQTHNTRQDSSGRVISVTQKLLPGNTLYSEETDVRASGGIRTQNPSKRAAADPRLKPRGHFKIYTTDINLRHAE